MMIEPEDRVYTVERWVDYEGWNLLEDSLNRKEADKLYEEDIDNRRIIVVIA